MKGGTALAAVLVLGLAIGGGLGYFGGGLYASGGTKTTTTTVISTLVGRSTTSTSVGLDLQAAFNNTVAPDLAVTSYSFGKGTLTVWVLNNGSEPFVITAHVPFLNGTTDKVASVISTDPAVVHVGSYLYVPPGKTIIVILDAQSFLTGQTGVLSIYGDRWSFVYGTQKD